MSRTTVGVLRGGPSAEYDVSLQTGAAILNALPEDEYRSLDILIDKQGRWHNFGRPMDPFRALQGVDVVVNGLHGAYGEDGTVQRILERANIPYTGSDPIGAAVSMNKPRAKMIARSSGLLVPRGISFSLPNEEDTWSMSQRVFREFAPPYVVKPSYSGSSVGVVLAPTLHALNDLLGDALDAHQAVLVEEYIRGKEATVGVVDDFRDHDIYVLPPVEIELGGRQLFDYDAKYSPHTKELCPSTFSDEVKQQLEHAARVAHQALGLTHYSRSDFRVHPSGTVYYLETNALPGLTETSLIPRALREVGSSLKEFLTHIINKALRR
ncbi:MAG: D-alanine--D-alanine ligase [Parcubacteria group bacterium]|nr:D-alanine--D-alanine ligase [Parcubacteria group bacterium]